MDQKTRYRTQEKSAWCCALRWGIMPNTHQAISKHHTLLWLYQSSMRHAYCFTIQLFMMASSNRNIFCVTGLYARNSPVTGEFPSQRPVTRSFDVFFHLSMDNPYAILGLICYRAHYDVIVMLNKLFERAREVGNPPMFLSLVGSSSHSNHALFSTYRIATKSILAAFGGWVFMVWCNFSCCFHSRTGQ